MLARTLSTFIAGLSLAACASVPDAPAPVAQPASQNEAPTAFAGAVASADPRARIASPAAGASWSWANPMAR